MCHAIGKSKRHRAREDQTIKKRTQLKSGKLFTVGEKLQHGWLKHVDISIVTDHSVFNLENTGVIKVINGLFHLAKQSHSSELTGATPCIQTRLDRDDGVISKLTW